MVKEIIDKVKKIIKNLARPGESLSSRAVKGVFWVFSLRITERVFQLIRTIILARLLSPKDFGLFGIALLVLSILGTFTETGFQKALIQKKGETRSFLDTVWTIGLIRGFIIAAIVFFLAKPATIFFDAPAAEPILRVIGASIILHSLTNIAVLYFQKELEFQKYFKYQLSGTIADVSVSITSALLLKSVWALVFGLLAGNLVRCIASYMIEYYRPRIYIKFSMAKELWGFGKWLLVSSIMAFFLIHGDDIFIGKVLGATMLGYYQMAYKISNLPATEVAHVVSSVTFPTYSKLQENLPKLRDAYFKVLQFVSFLSFPISGFIIVLAPDFTRLFLGEKWLPMVSAMQILTIAGLTRSISSIAGNVFYAIGRPDIETKWQIWRLLVLVVLIYPLTTALGISGASIAVFLSIFTFCIGSSFLVIKTMKIEFKIFTKVIVFPLISGMISMCSIFILKAIIGTGILEFFILALLGILIYLVVIYISSKFFSYNIRKLISESLNSIKKS